MLPVKTGTVEQHFESQRNTYTSVELVYKPYCQQEL